MMLSKVQKTWLKANGWEVDYADYDMNDRGSNARAFYRTRDGVRQAIQLQGAAWVLSHSALPTTECERAEVGETFLGQSLHTDLKAAFAATA